MTLKEFDAAMAKAGEIRRYAAEIITATTALEVQTFHVAGLECDGREAGFPCWRIEGVEGYFNTPREAVEAKEKA